MSAPRQLDAMDSAQKRALLKEVSRKRREERAQIPREHWDFAAFPEILATEAQYANLADLGVRDPTFPLHEAPSGTTTVVDGVELLNFVHYNYLGLARSDSVNDAAKAAIDRWGTTTGGSRLAAGEVAVHRELEAELAEFLGLEAALVFLGGHAANESTLGHILRRRDLLLHDALAHNSILQGGRLAGATLQSFPHLDYDAVDKILQDSRHKFDRVMLAVEGSYSAEGTVPDLNRFIALREKHRCLLFVDEAHSIGVLGRTGRGISEHCGVDPRSCDIVMGTLSKALGSAGGFIAGPRRLVTYLRRTAPGFVYSVGAPPPVAAAALASLRTLRAEPQRVARLRDRLRYFLATARRLGLDTGTDCVGPMVPIYVGTGELCLALSDALRRRSVIACPMLPPVVAPGTARLRFCVCADHTEAQIEAALDAVARELSLLRGAGSERPERFAPREASSPAGRVSPLRPQTDEEWRHRTVLVTGGTGGIGRSVALLFARAGANVIVIGRNPEGAARTERELRAAGATSAAALLGDLSSQDDVRRLAAALVARDTNIDVLINNAGGLFLRRSYSVDGIEMTWALNHLGPFLLTRLLIGNIGTGGRGWIVNVTSDAHANGTIAWRDPSSLVGVAAYSQSKLANVLFTRALHERLRGSGITSNAVQPGRTASGFGHNNGWIWKALRPLVHRGAESPDTAARRVARLVTDPRLAEVSGCYFDRDHLTQPSPGALDEAAAERLWTLSEGMTSAPAWPKDDGNLLTTQRRQTCRTDPR